MLVTLKGDGPVSHRLYRGVRAVILDGRWQAGTRLPSTRQLADELGISRKAVGRAFQRLADEGYVEARVGDGTYVAVTLPDPDLHVRGSRRSRRNTDRTALRLSTYAERVVAQSAWPPPGVRMASPYDFHYGTAAIGDFPQDVWARLVSRRARQLSIGMLRYGRTLGFQPLREAIAAYVRRARGVVTSADQVLIVNGSQQALYLLGRLLLDESDAVVVEEPGYQGARQIFAAVGAQLIPVDVDAAGLDVSQLPQGRAVRLAHVTPSHQFPMGSVLSLSRRLALLRWARQCGAYVIEDDYDSEFRYEGEPIEAIQALDTDGRVIYVGTFSKVLSPSLRIAYLVVPPMVVKPLASLKFLTDLHTPTFEQAVLADFIADGHFERHVRRARTRNAARRQALLAAADKHLGDRVEIVGANAGVHVVAWLRDVAASDIADFRQRALEAGLGLYSVLPYFLQEPPRAGLLMGYASLSETEIEDGIALLAQVLDRFASARSRQLS